MELKAILKALQAAERKYGQDLHTTEIVVYSDSAYSINIFKQGWYRNWLRNGWLNSKKQPVANREIIELIIPYFERYNLSFVKVKGHSGDRYNEQADSLANQGADLYK